MSRHEEVDNTPVEVPLRYRNRPDEVERMKYLIRTAMSEMAEENQLETFEEANDFDVDDGSDFDPSSPHEVIEDDEQFREFARDASIDDDKKREYVVRRRGGRRDRRNNDEEHDHGEDNETGVERGSARRTPRGAGGVREERRPAYPDREDSAGLEMPPRTGGYRKRPYRDTASGELVDPRDFDQSD